ncbi:MAG: hypothetical protein VX737_03405 [Pseudomonadota bacterium]|nr:hypothetical protein [Pseudomonadota bacterium]
MKLKYILPLALLSTSCFAQQSVLQVPFRFVNKSNKVVSFKLKTSKSFKGDDVMSWNSKNMTIKPQSSDSSGAVNVDVTMTTSDTSIGVFRIETVNRGYSYEYSQKPLKIVGDGFYCEIYSNTKIECGNPNIGRTSF